MNVAKFFVGVFSLYFFTTGMAMADEFLNTPNMGGISVPGSACQSSIFGSVTTNGNFVATGNTTAVCPIELRNDLTNANGTLETDVAALVVAKQPGATPIVCNLISSFNLVSTSYSISYRGSSNDNFAGAGDKMFKTGSLTLLNAGAIGGGLGHKAFVRCSMPSNAVIYSIHLGW